MNILEEILIHKHAEVRSRKNRCPCDVLEQYPFFERSPISIREALRRPGNSSIIAEIKRKSPSKGYLNKELSVEELATGYTQAEAVAISVLTDERYFAGTSHDLSVARSHSDCPILRKDFIIDEYQVLESKAIGADVILLIASALEPQEIKKLSNFAHSLKLEVLLEVHNKTELEANLESNFDVLGINNRDLKSFNVSIEQSLRLGALVPPTHLKISESGIETAAQAMTLKQAGFSGFLIGETFLRCSKPQQACADFIHALRQLQDN